VPTAAVEESRALVIVVREPSREESESIVDLARPLGRMLMLDKGTVLRMIWPLGEAYGHGSDGGSFLFPPSKDFDAVQYGFLRFLALHGPVMNAHEPLRFADAVAVAGIRAATGAQRRAVVLLLSTKPDTSIHDAKVVQHYLAALGVPFFVWSPTAEPPESAAAWGNVVDVSSTPKLAAALQHIRRTLAEQRIAWVQADPLTALRLRANASCGIETVARTP
jgi:hypothetical protein